ncbi:MAG: FAD-dependent oxidoreductase [Sporichthyaceae bacterium]
MTRPPSVATPQSPWLTEPAPTRASALGDLRAEVAVIGGGITGVTTALLLAEAGLDVVVCDAATVASGVSGANTAKVTALQSTIYSELTKRYASATAAVYARASLAGVELVAALAGRHAPDCGLSRRPAATVAATALEVARVEREFAAAKQAGLDVFSAAGVDSPLPCRTAVCLADQLTLHPVRYIRALAAAAEAAGARIHENTTVLGAAKGERWTLRTPAAHISAEHVVVASHYPMLDRGAYFARLEAKRSYCVAGTLRGPAPQCLAITAGVNTRSFAAVDSLAILGGEGHSAGARGVGPDRFEKLATDLRAWVDVEEVTYRWSAQDAVSFDLLPVIGAYVPGGERLWVASGYGKWGLSTGTIAARIIADRIMGRADDEVATVFTPTRLSPRAAPSLAHLLGKVAAELVGDRLRPGDLNDVSELGPGCAGVLRRGHRRTGVYRDATGTLHAVSNRCTHLGCLLRFNGAETSWDCPCHGSRFGVDGEVLEGPAVHPLAQQEI